ncbi:MAG: peptidoglycan editing factor PgeF [Salinivirgaceae bacterium]
MIHPIQFAGLNPEEAPLAFYTEKPFDSDPDLAVDMLSVREQLARERLVHDQHLVYALQTHTANVAVITEKNVHSVHPDVDGLITRQKGFCLCIETADCAPILLFDSVNKVVAALHAGWKGTAQEITTRAVGLMKEHYGTRPQDLFADVGPCISQKVYEVGSNVLEAFKTLPISLDSVFLPAIEPGKYWCNIKEANKLLLLHNGLQASRITISAHCTYADSDKFFSARRDGFDTGRMISGIMLR